MRPVDLHLLTGQGAQVQVGLRFGARPVAGDQIPEVIPASGVAAASHHVVQATGARVIAPPNIARAEFFSARVAYTICLSIHLKGDSMGILDWFKNRPGQYDPDRASAELIQWAVDKAVTLINPRLKLVSNYQKRLQPALEITIAFLRVQLSTLPVIHQLSPNSWASDNALRAFFVAAADISSVIGRSNNLRTLFDKFPELDEASLVLGMAFDEQKTFGMALHGDMVQRDVAQTSVNFSDHRARICSHDEPRLRRIIGVEIYEYLLAHALTEIGEERSERKELQENRSLIRARLRLLQQHGPGLGSMFGAEPAAPSEQAKLTAELAANEKQLEAIGNNENLLESELDCLTKVLSTPGHYIHFEPKHLRLNTMNVVLDESSTDRISDIAFSVAELNGTPPMRRAFVLARVSRSEMPPPQQINFGDAARYL